jgi:hypothetical protein
MRLTPLPINPSKICFQSSCYHISWKGDLKLHIHTFTWPLNTLIRLTFIQKHILTKQFFINRSFVDKNGLSNRFTSKNLLTSIFTLVDIAKILPKINFQKLDISLLCRVFFEILYTVFPKDSEQSHNKDLLQIMFFGGIFAMSARLKIDVNKSS